ncbi:MAG: MucB/RseB C-terminal domain-containing protein [Gammaproteobacteria bacterium]|nr:MucB/RseB C-terminal domain-containing protein [Gammaproteobacteria bacterium]MDX2488649.1 MucB/RseB C-terminal domain-containing protein [Gammaproteobacteria bacterium]
MKLVLQFLLLAGLLWMPLSWADEKAMDFLKRMNHAAGNLNYDGIFVHIDGHTVDTLRVIHKAENNTVLERLYALNGNPREVIRDAENVWCFMPERKMGHAGIRSDKKTGFPGFMVNNLKDLAKNYILSPGDEERIANRQAASLKILPRDAYRYGYQLWGDIETGLLLKSALIDASSNVIEQYMFAFIDIGGEISDTELQPMTRMDKLEWSNDKSPPSNTPISESSWQFDSLPAGYHLVNVMRRSMPMSNNQIEHMVLSDGLAGVSVFIQQVETPSTDVSLDSMGAVHAYTRIVDGRLVTAIGEVPAAAVKMIGNSLAKKH